MQKNMFWRRVLAVGLVAWMGFIFVMSSFPAGVSSQQSGVVVEVVEKVFRVDSAARPEVVGNLTEIVRKSVHAFEYSALGGINGECDACNAGDLLYRKIFLLRKLIVCHMDICII